MSNQDRTINMGTFDGRAGKLVIDAVVDFEHAQQLLAQFSRTGVEIEDETTGTKFQPWTSAADFEEYLRLHPDSETGRARRMNQN